MLFTVRPFSIDTSFQMCRSWLGPSASPMPPYRVIDCRRGGATNSIGIRGWILYVFDPITVGALNSDISVETSGSTADSAAQAVDDLVIGTLREVGVPHANRLQLPWRGQRNQLIGGVG